MDDNNYSLPCLLYDSQCTLCERFKKGLERLGANNTYTIISIHDSNIFSVYPQLKKEDCEKELHILDHDLKIYKGADAITHIAKSFPKVSKIAWLMETDAGKKTVDFFYDKAQKCREYLLNRCPNCR